MPSSAILCYLRCCLWLLYMLGERRQGGPANSVSFCIHPVRSAGDLGDPPSCTAHFWYICSSTSIWIYMHVLPMCVWNKPHGAGKPHTQLVLRFTDNF